MSLSFQINVSYCMSNLPILMVCSCFFNHSAFASVKKSSNLPGLFLVNKNMFPLLVTHGGCSRWVPFMSKKVVSWGDETDTKAIMITYVYKCWPWVLLYLSLYLLWMLTLRDVDLERCYRLWMLTLRDVDLERCYRLWMLTLRGVDLERCMLPF